MSIVERVDASVDFKFPQANGSSTVKEIEEYLFNARMRGAEDNTVVKFVVKEGYPYDNRSYTSGISVKVPATMGGFPVVQNASKAMDPRKKAQALAIGGVVCLVGFIASIVAIILAVF